MKHSTIFLIMIFIVSSLGCSGMSNIERANLTQPEAREEYVRMNPDGSFNGYIKNGEITTGMNVYEVLASWGYPNVYLTSRHEPREHWIYYVENEDSRSILIYTLTFDSDILGEWEIDIKRFIDYRVGYEQEAREEFPEDSRTAIKKQ